jgi:hypothetical protein
MKKPTYSIRDNIAKFFNFPFMAMNDDDAIRSFTNSIKKEMPDRLEEYSLYHNGWFDDSTGAFESLEPTVIFRGIDINTKPKLEEVSNG